MSSAVSTQSPHLPTRARHADPSLQIIALVLKGITLVSATLIILAIVVITALAFDFTNGFHDTANAMATSIATGALKPFTAVAISAVLNLIGAFLSVNVAATVAKGIVNLCLLYTSPSPRDLSTSRMPSSA